MAIRAWLPWRDPAAYLGGMPAGFDVDYYPGGPPPASIAEVEFYVPAYVGGSEVVEVVAEMPALRVVQTQTAGYDDVLPHLRDDVTLCNARGVHDAATAELAMALILATYRQIPRAVRDQDRREWPPLDGFHDSLADRTVLILGYGSIGSALDRRLDGFECEVLRVARRARPGVAPLEDLPTLLPRADVVVVLVPLTERTRGMVDARFLAAMRDGAVLVNIARGAIVDTDALLAALRAGRLRAALDVTDPEPLPRDHPLWSAPNVLITPHRGGAATSFDPRVAALIREQLRRYAAGEPLRHVVAGPPR